MATKNSEMGHAKWKPYDDQHAPAGAYEGGACLGAHEQYYMENHSCSYRWQACKRAEGSDASLYGTFWQNPTLSNGSDNPHYWKKWGKGMRTVTAASTFFKNNALTRKHGAGGQVTARPFRTAFSPWNNNAHHLLCDAALRNAIFDITEPAPSIEILLINGLLDECYNINIWKNMIILPQDREIAGLCGLPSHAGGDQHGTAYMPMVRTEVDAILVPYETVVEQVVNKEDHDVPDAEEIKDALNALSMRLHKGVVAQASAIKAAADTDKVNLCTLTPAIKAAMGT